jgi:hypothetical protein
MSSWRDDGELDDLILKAAKRFGEDELKRAIGRALSEAMKEAQPVNEPSLKAETVPMIVLREKLRVELRRMLQLH